MFTLLNGVKLAFFNIDAGPVNTDFILKTCCLHLLGFPNRQILLRDDILYRNKLMVKVGNPERMLQTRVHKDGIARMY